MVKLARLIKVPFVSDGQPGGRLKSEASDKFNYALLGRSKIKALQNGLKQTGIYRQFYNTQAKSADVILSHH